MAELPSAFKTSDHDDMMDFTAIPEADCKDLFKAQIIESKWFSCKETAKDPNGKYVKLTFKILEGKYKGRLLWTQLNLINKSEQAVKISNSELATMVKAAGKVSVTDTQEIHGIPMKLKVAYVPGSANWPPKNEIKFYYPMNATAENNESVSEAPSQDAEQAAPKKKPWE